MTQQMRANKDVFDEMNSWYVPMKMIEDVDGESSNSGSNISPWTWRLPSIVASHGSAKVVHMYHKKGKKRWISPYFLMCLQDPHKLMVNQMP